MAAEAELLAGCATPDGTRRFAERFSDLPGHFRRPDRLHLSSFGLGMRRGEAGGVDDLLYRSAIGTLLEGGVNVFDTALSERGMQSERNLGASLARAFRDGDAARDEVVVVTRGGFFAVDSEGFARGGSARAHLWETYVETGLVDPERVAQGVHCLDPGFLLDQIERSRRNLGLATIDLYLVDEPELHLFETGPDEFQRRLRVAFEALERAASERLIGAYGLCTWDGFLRAHTDRYHLSLLDVFDWALDVGGGDHHLRALQLPCSLAMAEAFRLDSQIGPAGTPEAVLSALRGTGTTVLASAPLAQGRALGRLPAFVHEAFPELASDAQRCLQFARSAPGVTTAIVGMREPDHVDENLALARVPPATPEAIEDLFKRAAAPEPG